MRCPHKPSSLPLNSALFSHDKGWLSWYVPLSERKEELIMDIVLFIKRGKTLHTKFVFAAAKYSSYYVCQKIFFPVKKKIYIFFFLSNYLHKHVYIYVCVCVCIYIYIYICVCVCVYLSVYLSIYLSFFFFFFFFFFRAYLSIYLYISVYIQPQIRKSWDSMENANKKRK